jgi:type I restriction enzyme, S subunit
VTPTHGLPSGWKSVPLAELAAPEPNSITDGPFGSKLKTEHYTESGPRVLRLQNIGDGFFFDERAHISDAHFGTLQKHRVFEGDLIIAALGETLPRACIVPATLGPAIVKADCIRFKPNHRLVSSKFLLYALIAPQVRHAAATIIHGVGRPRLNLSELKSLPVPLAPREDQDRIVAEIEKQFTRLDSGVAALERLQAHLRRYRAAVLKAACEGTLTASPMGTPRPLAEIADIQLGQQRAPVHADAAVQLPYVRAANITWRGLDLTDVKTMGFPNPNRYRLEHGDVLLVEASGSPMEAGKPVVWRSEIPECYYQKALIRVRPRGPDLLPDYLYVWFLNDAIAGRFARMAPGVGIVHLTAERMQTWPVCVPSRAHQEKIVDTYQRHASEIDATQSMVDRGVRRAEALRRSILRSAFDGRLVAPEQPARAPAA